MRTAAVARVVLMLLPQTSINRAVRACSIFTHTNVLRGRRTARQNDVLSLGAILPLRKGPVIRVPRANCAQLALTQLEHQRCELAR